MITVTFSCGGCFKKVEGTTFLSRHFVSLSGRDYGIGSYRYDQVTDVVPDGWIAYDPYTGATYCPECWQEIESLSEARAD